MKAWAEKHGANPALWTVATGDPARLKNVIGAGFSTYYGADGAGGWEFDPAFVLVDGNGIIRTKYRTATPNPETFVRDLDLVLAEVAGSSGASRLAYDAAHLFLCYPE
jgi:protein SCO1/2